MDLPPQPQPSTIDVTCEDDPLTLEWPAAFGNSKRAGKALAWGIFGAVLGLLCLLTAAWLVSSLQTLDLYPLIVAVGFTGGFGILAANTLRRATRLASDTGSARLVLHNDSVIWVAGGGTIPHVYRKSEITGISAIPTLKPRQVGFVLEEAPHPRFHVVLKGRFAPGDLAWLAGVLGRWFATKP